MYLISALTWNEYILILVYNIHYTILTFYALVYFLLAYFCISKPLLQSSLTHNTILSENGYAFYGIL